MRTAQLTPGWAFAQALQALVQLFSKPCAAPDMKWPVSGSGQPLLGYVTGQWRGWGPCETGVASMAG